MSDEWVSASEARAIVSQGWQDDGKPTEAICLHAKHGEIQAKARRWITIENGHRYEKGDEIIPRAFWNDGDMQQNWSHGIFQSTIYPDDTKFEIEALGVTFERAGIAALASIAMQAKLSPADPAPGTQEAQSARPQAKSAERRKLPPLSQDALQRWWKGLGNADRDLPSDILHKLCMSAHPANSIARDRVRQLVPKRKPGPRPIQPKSSAYLRLKLSA